MRTTELNIVELDTSGNYRDRTSHNKKNIIWFTDTLMKNLLNFENELIEYEKIVNVMVKSGKGWDENLKRILFCAA